MMTQEQREQRAADKKQYQLFAWIGSSFLGALAPDLCRPDLTREEVSARLKSYGSVLAEHWRP